MTKKYILASLSICILIINIILYLVALHSINLYQLSKDTIITIFLISILVISILTYLSKHNTIYNSGILLTIITNIILINSIYNLNQDYSYLNNLYTNTYEYKDYSVYVQKKNTIYNDISKLENKKIGILDNNYNNTCSIIQKEITIECINYKDISSLEESLQNGEIQAFIIENTYYNKLPDTKEIKYQTCPLLYRGLNKQR